MEIPQKGQGQLFLSYDTNGDGQYFTVGMQIGDKVITIDYDHDQVDFYIDSLKKIKKSMKKLRDKDA
jgi:hypothetical protein